MSAPFAFPKAGAQLIKRVLSSAVSVSSGSGMSQLRPSKYTWKEWALAALAFVNMIVLVFVKMDGHCFFNAIAESETLNGRPVTGLRVRERCVAEMRGKFKHLYQRIWCAEHYPQQIERRQTSGWNLSNAMQRQWEQYLKDMASEGLCQGTGGWVVSGRAWQDNAVRVAAERAFKVRLAEFSVSDDGKSVGMRWSSDPCHGHVYPELMKGSDKWAWLPVWHQGAHWDPLVALNLEMCLVKENTRTTLPQDFEAEFKAGHALAVGMGAAGPKQQPQRGAKAGAMAGGATAAAAMEEQTAAKAAAAQAKQSAKKQKAKEVAQLREMQDSQLLEEAAREVAASCASGSGAGSGAAPRESGKGAGKGAGSGSARSAASLRGKQGAGVAPPVSARSAAAASVLETGKLLWQ